MKDLIVILAIVSVAHTANGLYMMDEDKRQGLIPFPRVGRTNEYRESLFDSPYIMSPYYGQREAMLDQSDSVAPMGPHSALGPDFFVRLSRRDKAFVPRLGRRKRSLSMDEEENDTSKGYNLNPKVMALSDILRKSPWTIITFKGVDKKMAFSPRLGRAMIPRLGRKRSDEEVDKRAPSTTPILGDNEDAYTVASRASAFSPRLGRGDAMDTQQRQQNS